MFTLVTVVLVSRACGFTARAPWADGAPRAFNEGVACRVPVCCAVHEFCWDRFSLDLFVVLLGGAVALMPIFAHEILHQGPRGLGMLCAAPAVGAVTMSLIMARFPMHRHAGRWLFICVAIFGGATVVFGLSHVCWLSLGALAIAGAADTISVIIRRIAVTTGHAAGDAGAGERGELAVYRRFKRVWRV